MTFFGANGSFLLNASNFRDSTSTNSAFIQLTDVDSFFSGMYDWNSVTCVECIFENITGDTPPILLFYNGKHKLEKSGFSNNNGSNIVKLVHLSQLVQL
jgi:hypothetical protein